MLGGSIIGYLFLGGTGAGACVVFSFLGFTFLSKMTSPCPHHSGAYDAAHMWCGGAPSYSSHEVRFFGMGYTTALLCLLTGALLLLSDLGRPERILMLLLPPWDNYLTLGSYALGLTTIVCLMLSMIWWGVIVRVHLITLRILQACGIAAGAVCSVYTGLLLADIYAMPLWHSPFLVGLFATSAFSCGAAVVLGCSLASSTYDLLRFWVRRIFIADSVIIGIEVLFVVGLLISHGLAALDTPTAKAAYESVWMLINGPLSLVFWIVFIGGGLVAPFLLESILIRFPIWHEGVALCMGMVLVGGLALRYCIVAAALQPMVSSAAAAYL